MDHSFNATFYMLVEKDQGGQPTSDGAEGILGPLSEVGLVLLTLLGASAVIVFLYRRHLSSQRRTQNPLRKTKE
jgi:hypothetical protein